MKNLTCNTLAILCLALFSALSDSTAAYSPAKQNLPDQDRARTVIITFDDGPRTWIAPQILEFFRTEEIPALFFVQCWRIQDNAEGRSLLIRASREGHGIANHTYGHGNMLEFASKRGTALVLSDVERCSDAIEATVGYSPKFFRPPYWAINAELQRRLENLGYITQIIDDPALPAESRIFRDVNTTDYAFHDQYLKNPRQAVADLTDRIRKRINERERAGITVHVLAFHELPVALGALKILVPEWKEQGYEFRTLPWLYGREDYRK